MSALVIVFPRRGLTVPEALERAADKAAARRFTGEAPTGFGALADDHFARRQRIREEAALGLDCVDDDDSEVWA